MFFFEKKNITKCDKQRKFHKYQHSYFKVRQALQNETEFTANYDSVLQSVIRSEYRG